MLGLGEKEAKRVKIYVAAACAAAAWLLFSDGEETAMLEEMDFDPLAGAPPDLLPSQAQQANINLTEGVSPSSIVVSTGEMQGGDSMLTSADRGDFVWSLLPDTVPVQALPSMQVEAVWEALDRIAAWYAAPLSVPQNVFLSYLTHRKLWVRLASLQFAVSTSVDRDDLLSLAVEQMSQIVGPHETGQARRFLRRAEEADIATYHRMRGLLSL